MPDVFDEKGKTMTHPSPFPKVAKRPRRQKIVDTSMLRVEHNTPLPENIRINGKYDALFSNMKPGSCIACERSESECVCNALRKWIQRNKITGMKIIKHSNCEDGKARIWLVKDNL
jgi:hypothetical protein